MKISKILPHFDGGFPEWIVSAAWLQPSEAEVLSVFSFLPLKSIETMKSERGQAQKHVEKDHQLFNTYDNWA